MALVFKRLKYWRRGVPRAWRNLCYIMALAIGQGMKKYILAAFAILVGAVCWLVYARVGPVRKAKQGDPTRPEDHLRDPVSTPDGEAGADSGVSADRASRPDTKAGPDPAPSHGP